MEGGGGGEGGWELITWEAFCPAPAAAVRMQMKEASRLGEKTMARMGWCALGRAGMDAPSSAPHVPGTPSTPAGLCSCRGSD